MVQLIRAITIVVITILNLSEYVKAADWTIDDFYRDSPRVFMLQTNPIDLEFDKKSNGIGYIERKKTLQEDFHEFLKENLYTYTMLWSIRVIYDPQNVQAVFTPSSFRRWLTNNITGWQGCNGKAASRGQCSARKPFTAFPIWDGDYVKTNLVQHPIFGAGVYLYYRANGYDRTASSLASIGLSALYEYTVEGWMQSPSITDLILTPGLGIPLGIVLEETSNLLAESDNQFIRGLSYAVNPARVFIPDGQIAWHTLLGRTVTLQFSW
jgi:uncharacterized protein DUF3943